MRHNIYKYELYIAVLRCCMQKSADITPNVFEVLFALDDYEADDNNERRLIVKNIE